MKKLYYIEFKISDGINCNQDYYPVVADNESNAKKFVDTALNYRVHRMYDPEAFYEILNIKCMGDILWKFRNTTLII